MFNLQASEALLRSSLRCTLCQHFVVLSFLYYAYPRSQAAAALSPLV